jgi:hypothetical protein
MTENIFISESIFLQPDNYLMISCFFELPSGRLTFCFKKRQRDKLYRKVFALNKTHVRYLSSSQSNSVLVGELPMLKEIKPEWSFQFEHALNTELQNPYTILARHALLILLKKVVTAYLLDKRALCNWV